jgi:hypothetical protein
VIMEDKLCIQELILHNAIQEFGDSLIFCNKMNRYQNTETSNNIIDINFIIKNELDYYDDNNASRFIDTYLTNDFIRKHKTDKFNFNFYNHNYLFQIFSEKGNENFDAFLECDILYDNGIFQDLLLISKHKNSIIKDDNLFISSYSITGSLVSCKSNYNDIDVLIIVDDSMISDSNRIEVLNYSKTIISNKANEYIFDNKSQKSLHSSVYLLSDFWWGLNTGNPVHSHLVRNSIDLYDSGFVRTWRYLLKTGKIKFSREAIWGLTEGTKDLFFSLNIKIDLLIIESLYDYLFQPLQAIFIIMEWIPLNPNEMIIAMSKKLAFGEFYFIEHKQLEFMDYLLKLVKKKGKASKILFRPDQISTILIKAEITRKILMKEFEKQYMEMLKNTINANYDKLKIKFSKYHRRIKKHQTNISNKKSMRLLMQLDLSLLEKKSIDELNYLNNKIINLLEKR